MNRAGSQWLIVWGASLAFVAAVALFLWRLPSEGMRGVIGFTGLLLSSLVACGLLVFVVRALRRRGERAGWVLLCVGAGVFALASLCGFLGAWPGLPLPIPLRSIFPWLLGAAHLPLWGALWLLAGARPRRFEDWGALLADIALPWAALWALAAQLGVSPPTHTIGKLAIYTVLGSLALLQVMASRPAQVDRQALRLFPVALLLLSADTLAALGLSPWGHAAGVLLSLALLGAGAAGLYAISVPAFAGPPSPREHPAGAPLLLPAILTILVALPVWRVGISVQQLTPLLALAGARFFFSALLTRALGRRLVDSERLSHTDSLTGLANKRAFQERLQLEKERAKRYGRPFAIIFGDIDFFKLINDAHGHPAGDRALCMVGQTLRDGVRGSDMVSRFGGEEFVILLPEATLAQAGMLAERLRATVENLAIPVPGQVINVTISLGVAASPETATDPDALLEAADQAMNRAKETGRNRVIAAPSGQRLYVV